MKITIKYTAQRDSFNHNNPLSDDNPPRAIAYTEINDDKVGLVMASGESYDEARKNLINQIRLIIALGDVPKSEEIEATYKPEEINIQ